MNNLLKLFLPLLLSLPLAARAQDSVAVATPATLNFCGLDLPLDSGCKPISAYEVVCDTYKVSWVYLDFKVMQLYPPQYLKQLEKEHKGAEKQTLTCSLLGGPPVQAVRLSYPVETGGMAYHLVVFGVAKSQPVMINLILNTDPEKTADLPPFVQQILQLSK